MELLQELLFTISFSLIVSLFIAKLFSMASSCDDDTSTISKRVEEKIEKEWVVCGSETGEGAGYFEDAVKVREEVVRGYVEAEFGSGFVIGDPKSVGGVGESFLFDESPKRAEFKDTDVSLVKSDEGNVEQWAIEDTSAVESVLAGGTGSFTEEDRTKSIEVQQESSAIGVADDGGEVKIEEGDGIFDDDWQGIETTELEKSFGAAVAFMASKSSADQVSLIDNEAKMQLYGLHKVAIEGPCLEPQPMALKVSARANWNAWKRLENTGREDAMERYIALLSRQVPDWMGRHASEDGMQNLMATGASGKLHLDQETPTRAENERILDQTTTCIDSMAVEDSNVVIKCLSHCSSNGEDEEFATLTEALV